MKPEKPQGTPNDLDARIEIYLSDNHPGQIDQPDQQLARRLQKYYQPGQEHELALKRVHASLERFQNNGHSVNTSEQEATPLSRVGQFKAPHLEKRRGLSRTLGLLAAVLLAVLLLGSTLFVVRQARLSTSNTASHKQKATSSNTQRSDPQQLYVSYEPVFSNSTLTQLNQKTGKANWQFTLKPTDNTQGSIVSTSITQPQAMNGLLYFLGNDANGTTVYALDAARGTQVWRFPVGNDFGNLVVANGLVYTIQWQASRLVVLALDARTGHIVWQNPYQSSIPPRGVSMLIVGTTSHGLYLAGSTAQNLSVLYALNAQTGVSLWQTVVSSSERINSAQITGNMLYLAGQGGPAANAHTPSQVYAYNLNTHQQAWSKTVDGTVASLALAQQTLYAEIEGKDQEGSLVAGAIYALNATDGNVLWQQHLSQTIVSFVLANGEIYLFLDDPGAGYTIINNVVSGPNWQMAALKGNNGQSDWQKTLQPTFSANFVAFNSLLYLVNRNAINVFDASNGKRVRTIALSKIVSIQTLSPSDPLLFLA